VELTAAILCIVYMKEMPAKLRYYMAENLRSNYTGTFYDRQFDRSVDWTQINVSIETARTNKISLSKISSFFQSTNAAASTRTETTRTATITTQTTSTRPSTWSRHRAAYTAIKSTC
jgi:hypothetical protein